TDDEGHFIWPGFGDNMRVLNWILARCDDKVGAVETPIGYVPEIKDIDIEGLDITEDTIKELLTVDKDVWTKETENIAKFYEQFGDKLPKEIVEEFEGLKARLK
ncbi:MAG: phosphoenolpyruvate carboxykinase domain-containing protein, partial [Acutalibacteraceae bacterium]